MLHLREKIRRRRLGKPDTGPPDERPRIRELQGITERPQVSKSIIDRPKAPTGIIERPKEPGQ
jgi:hypothetical protein